jgi:hypothetical protein
MRFTGIPAPCARALPLVALCLALASRAHAASAPLGPDVWSMQLDGGLYAPLEATGGSPTGGMRYCKHATSHLQIGMLTGWTFKRAKLESTTGGQEGPISHVELARADANLVPLMAFMQVDLTDRARLVPFFGFGVGFEWLILHSLNHQTGAQSKATYGNVAWETYTGMGLRLSEIWRLNSELYYNGGSLERKFPDPAQGGLRREAVHVNGVGVRFGVDMKFD